ncbi:cytospin-A isoform X6 [Plodia interpunctella]|uniref:cytospin-A isoform X6 n=1 Tax=Plodia interpunctella TaxID=58824 RepID=UPI002367DB4A|nr:cytospin-A isoform X7 [Plodia interpunctella]
MMWTGVRRRREYQFVVIEEVMQQKAPLVPSNIKLQQPSTPTVRNKGFSANFFKATFSSRSKAVPTASSIDYVEESIKIGSAETKPITRNRPRTAPQESNTKVKLKRTDLAKPPVRRPTKLALDPKRPERIKSASPDPGGSVTTEISKHDLKTQKSVIQIVKKSHILNPADSLLPPSLKPKVGDKNVKLTKNINNNDVWTNANDIKTFKRPAPPTPVRGPSQGKQESTLKGAPSVSSLDSKHHKVAPARDKSLKIFGSKEKLHKPKKKDLGNNNAVLEDPELREALDTYEDAQPRVGEYGSAEELGSIGERGSQECISLPVTLNAEHMPGFQEVELDLRPRLPSEASLASGAREIESLRQELEATAMERAQLQARVDELLEKVAEADRLRGELDRLKSIEAEREAALERLADENGALRARLRGVAHSPLSDSEKRQLLLAPAPRRMHSSAPASIALAHNGEGDSGEASTPEWDKHSSSSLSEVSVACLQDRIQQMEEHHYSTSEELQATLAELADLQTQLADAHADNERLAEEKQLLLESLCQQTEKLEDSRTKVDTLQLLLREGAEPETVSAANTDQQLFAVLKVSQEERRLLQSKQEQLEAELKDTKAAVDDKTKDNAALQERVRVLESTLERTEAERLQWEHEAGAALESAAARQQQLDTLTELLDAAKAKLSERAGAAEGAAEAEAAAAAARREAEAAAARAHALAERLAHAQRQLDRAHSDARKLHDDALVSRNTAKSTISELEFQLEQMRQEKAALQGEMKTLQDNMAELQIQVQVTSDEKLSLMSRASEALSRAADAERQLQDARTRLAQLVRDRDRDEAEWKQFQSDLLMTVRVANDFKTEAQRELERLVSENKLARDRIRLLEDQIHSMKAIPPRTEETPPPPLLTSASLQDIMATAASHRRNKGVSRQDSRLSVKSLIESIENAAKAAKQSPTTPVGDWPQQTTVVSATSNPLKNGMSEPPAPPNGLPALPAPFAPKTPARSVRTAPITTDSPPPANIPDEQRALSLQQKAIESFVRRNSYGDICERKDPLNALQKNGGSKRNALLKWCQQKTLGYNNIDITNFSSSWNDGLALCALLHSYLGDGRINYVALSPNDKRTNFSMAFAAAESVGIPTTLNIQDMIQQERPDWQQVMAYVTSIYKHFET